MAEVVFVTYDGTVHRVEVEPGVNIMEAAIENSVPGIDGDCGGNAACGTCHIHVDPDWAGRLSARSEDETAMLDFAEGVDEMSRLACQILVAEELDGLKVHLPRAQY